MRDRERRASAFESMSFVFGRHPLAGFAARRPGVGRHRGGRFWRRAGLSRGAHRDPGHLQIGARRLPADARRLFNSPERPAQPPQGDHLLALLDAQDVGHPGGERDAHRRCQRPGAGAPGGRFSGVDHWPVLGVDRGCTRPSAFGPITTPATRKPTIGTSPMRKQRYAIAAPARSRATASVRNVECSIRPTPFPAARSGTRVVARLCNEACRAEHGYSYDDRTHSSTGMTSATNASSSPAARASRSY